MALSIAEVLDQDGETWIKTDLLDPDPPGHLALVALGGAEALLGREWLRLPCGAVLQIFNASVPFNGAVELFSPGEGRPPRLEAGMALEVDTGGVCAGSVARCEGEPGTLEQKFLRSVLGQQRIWVARHFLSWCNPGRPWP